MRALEAASGLGRARRLAGSLRRPTRARPRTQNPSRARVARCGLAHDRRLERRRPAVHLRRSGRRSRLLAIAESRTSGNSRPAAASARRRPRKVDAAPAAACHAACIDPQAPSRTGATRARRTAYGASQVRTHCRHARAHARTRPYGEQLAHRHLTPRAHTQAHAPPPRRHLPLPLHRALGASRARTHCRRSLVPRAPSQARSLHFRPMNPRACMPLTPTDMLRLRAAPSAPASPCPRRKSQARTRSRHVRTLPRLCVGNSRIVYHHACVAHSLGPCPAAALRPPPRAPLPFPLVSPSSVKVWPSRCGVNPAPVGSRRRARLRPRPCGARLLSPQHF